jgi:preprotein translocase subunit YajC
MGAVQVGPDGTVLHFAGPGPQLRVGGPGFALGARAFGLLGGFGPVHADAVVPNGSGGFTTITLDRGTVQTVSGQDLTITEGTATATYKTVTLTIPSGAKVARNGASASLSSLKKGDTAIVVQGLKGTHVIAFAAGFKPLALAPAPGQVKVTALRGTVKSLSGNQLAINTPENGTQTVAVPSGATVVRNGASASLSNLQKGDRVIVIETPKGTRVFAFSGGSGPPDFLFDHRGGDGPQGAALPPPYGPPV